MGKKVGLTDANLIKITLLLSTGMSTFKISKNTNCDHLNYEGFVHCGKTKRKAQKRNHLRKLSPPDIHKIKIQVEKKSHETI